MPWYVLYTKPRNEKKIAALLTSKGIKVYCPVQEIVKQWSDRKKKVHEPVFRSYVFVFLSEYALENVPVLETPGAVRFLWWQGKPGVVRDKEIEAISDFLNAYKNVKLSVDFQSGDYVTIQEGPLKDRGGQLLSIHGRKAILHLDVLGIKLVAEIPVQSLSKTTKQ